MRAGAVPRQTGKSTLIRRRFGESAWRIDLLHGEEFLKYSKDPSLLRREAAHKIQKDLVRTIFIDEVQ